MKISGELLGISNCIDNNNRGSCNSSQTLNIRPRKSKSCNRFNSSRQNIYQHRHAAMMTTSTKPFSLLMLVAISSIALIILPYQTEATTVADITTNSLEFTTEQTVLPTTILPLVSPPIVIAANENITSNQTQQVVDVANEILTVFDDGINKQVQLSATFEKSSIEDNDPALTENLEETIRNSVKTEIEMEQNVGSSALIDALKDISEAEVRQKLTEELSAREHTHNAEIGKADEQIITIEEEKRKNEKLDEVVGEIKESHQDSSSNPSNDPVIVSSAESVSFTPTNVNSSEFPEAPQVIDNPNPSENVREARNLETAAEHSPNALENTKEEASSSQEEGGEVHSNEELSEIKSESIHIPIESNSNSSSGSSESSQSNSNENMQEVDNKSSNENMLKHTIDNTATSNNEEAKISTDNHSLGETSSLSIVLEETLNNKVQMSETDDNNLQSLIGLEADISATQIMETTVAPESTQHNVIKKQGVEMNPSEDFDNNEEIQTTADEEIEEDVELPINEGKLKTLEVMETVQENEHENNNEFITEDTEKVKEDVIDEVNVLGSEHVVQGEPNNEKISEKNDVAVLKEIKSDLLDSHTEVNEEDTVQQEIVVSDETNHTADENQESNNNESNTTEAIEDELEETNNTPDENPEPNNNESNFSKAMEDESEQTNHTPDENQEPNNNESNITEPMEDESEIKSISEQVIDSDQSEHSEPNVAKEVNSNTAETNDIESSTLNAEHFNTLPDNEKTQVVDEETDKLSSSKGSRSISNHLDDGAATPLESYSPRVAGQTLNDNLAAESAGGIDRALLTTHQGDNAMSRSSIIISICSSIAILFIFISVTIFIISFQRQHGTLDIEMQEQKLGKDNLDEEDAETCTRLLEIELPKPVAIVMEEAEECL